MRVSGVQLNQQTFGTKVKINKQLRQSFSRKDGGAALNEYIRTLENNGINDNFVVASVNKKNNALFHADVLKLKGLQLYIGKSVLQSAPTDECPNLAKMYLQASQNMHPFI